MVDTNGDDKAVKLARRKTLDDMEGVSEGSPRESIKLDIERYIRSVNVLKVRVRDDQSSGSWSKVDLPRLLVS